MAMTATAVSEAAAVAWFGTIEVSRIASNCEAKPSGVSRQIADSNSSGINKMMCPRRSFRWRKRGPPASATPIARLTPSAASNAKLVPARQTAATRAADAAAIGMLVNWNTATTMPLTKASNRKNADMGSSARCSDSPGGPTGRSSAVAGNTINSKGRHSKAPRPQSPVVTKLPLRRGMKPQAAPTSSRAAVSTTRSGRIGSLTSASYHHLPELASHQPFEIMIIAWGKGDGDLLATQRIMKVGRSWRSNTMATFAWRPP